MTAPAALAGSYADFKLVKTRAVAQLVIEIPIEQAEAAITMFGIPMAGTEIPVAIAMLVKETTAPKPVDIARSERAKLAYREMPEWQKAALRAALLCGDPKFRNFLVERYDALDTEDSAAEAVRVICEVDSRRTIGLDERAFHAFIALETEYKIATGQMAERR